MVCVISTKPLRILGIKVTKQDKFVTNDLVKDDLQLFLETFSRLRGSITATY